MADVKLTAEADVSQALRENQKLAESEKAVERQFAKSAQGKEQATKKIAQSANEAAAAVQTYELAASGGAASGAAVRFAPGRGRAPRSYGLAPVSAGASASGLVVPSAAGTVPLAHEVAMSTRSVSGLARMDLLLARGSRIGAAAGERLASRTAERDSRLQANVDRQNDLDAELAELRLRHRDQVKADRLVMRNRLASGTLAVGAAVTAVAAQAEEEMNRYADTLLQFNNQMTPLYGVGGNSRIRSRLRSDVLAISGGTGIPAGEVASMKFGLQSAAADLPEAVKQAIEASSIQFYQLQRTNMQQMSTAMVGALQVLGPDVAPGAAGVKQLSSKLGAAADIGSFEIEQYSPYLASMLGAFKATGYSQDDAFAAMAMASKLGMRPEATTTALRNLPLLMTEGRKKLGKDLPRDFGQAMQVISGLENQDLLDLVGRDAFVLAKSFGQNAGQFGKARDYIAQFGPGADFVGGKLSGRVTDALALPTEIISSARQIGANATMLNADVRPDLLNSVTDWEVRKAGAELTTSPLFSWFKSPSVWVEQADEAVRTRIPFGDYDPLKGRNRLLIAGAATIASQARQAGDEVKASYTELAYGITGAGTTGRAEAEEYRRIVGQGYVGLSGGEFMEYKRLGQASAAAASTYLAKVGGFQAPGAGATGGNPLANLAVAAQAAANYVNGLQGGGNAGRSVSRIPVGVAAPAGLQ